MSVIAETTRIIEKIESKETVLDKLQFIYDEWNVGDCDSDDAMFLIKKYCLHKEDKNKNIENKQGNIENKNDNSDERQIGEYTIADISAECVKHCDCEDCPFDADDGCFFYLEQPDHWPLKLITIK